MAQYTMTLKTIIENGVNIFNFSYPIFDEEYRKVFEEKFIKHFFFEEIAFETVGQFIFKLNEKLNLLMPYYNKLYLAERLELRILDNYQVVETYEKENTENSNINSVIDKISNGENTNKSKSLFSDTPRKKVDIENFDYVSNISKDDSTNKYNATDKNIANNEVVNKGSEKWTRKMEGNIGVQTDSEAVKVYKDTLFNTDLLLFEELENLFMLIY